MSYGFRFTSQFYAFIHFIVKFDWNAMHKKRLTFSRLFDGIWPKARRVQISSATSKELNKNWSVLWFSDNKKKYSMKM